MTKLLIATAALAGLMGAASAQQTPRPYEGSYETPVSGAYAASDTRPATLREFFARDVLGPNFIIKDNHDYSGK